MSSISTLLGVKRRLGQLSRRARSGPVLRAGPLSEEVRELLTELGDSAVHDPEVAVELALNLLEQLPGIFAELDDREGLLGKALDEVPELLRDLLELDLCRVDSALDRPAVFQRLFDLWVEDPSGYLQNLDLRILEASTEASDESSLMEICRCYLRDLPLVFPAKQGEKLDIERHLLRTGRYTVERLVGEVHARHEKYEYSVVCSGAWMRETGDAVDHINALERAGRWEEALETARKVLRSSSAPRRQAVRSAYERIASEHSKFALERKTLQRTFLRNPSWEAWTELLDNVHVDWRASFVDETLNALEATGLNSDLCFQLYVEEDLILEADGLASHQPITAQILADSAEIIADEHPDRSAGWFLMAAYAAAARGRRAAYEKSAQWMQRVRHLSEATQQVEGFSRALQAFMEHNARRKVLIELVEAAMEEE